MAATDKAAGPVLTPLGAPTPASKPAAPAVLTADQQKKYDAVLEQVKAWTEVPSTKGKGGPITDDERLWLTRECLLRFLRATKWNQKDAANRVLETLTWRREYGVQELTAEHVSPENETGKQIIVGYDKEAHPCHYLNPGRQNTDPSPRQVQHLVYMLERVIDLMPPQQEKLALLINFKSSKSRSNTAPGIGLAREVLNILQTYYPERLGKALIINVPWVVWGFFKLITPFIDPLTREKLKFNEDMRQYVPEEQLWTEFNGTLNFDYDHATYWPALAQLCSERREARRQRWVAGGQNIGEYEEYLAGHIDVGVTGPVTAKSAETTEEPRAAATEEKVAETTPATKAADEVRLVAPSEAEPTAVEGAGTDQALAEKTKELTITDTPAAGKTETKVTPAA